MQLVDSDGTSTTESGGPLQRLLLDRHGTAVVLRQDAAAGMVLGTLAFGGSAIDPVDSGPIDPASVQLGGGVLSWTNAGQPHSLALTGVS